MVKDLPVEEINKNFRYDNGDLYWRFYKTGRKMGNPLRNKNKFGYLRATFNNKHYTLHRIVWIIHNGAIPKGLDIDHINRVRDDNRIENIRLVTRSQNLHNTTAKGGNKGGCVGVNWNKINNYWQASICINYKIINLGVSKSFFEACCLRKEGEVKYKKEIWG